MEILQQKHRSIGHSIEISTQKSRTKSEWSEWLAKWLYAKQFHYKQLQWKWPSAWEWQEETASITWFFGIRYANYRLEWILFSLFTWYKKVFLQRNRHQKMCGTLSQVCWVSFHKSRYIYADIVYLYVFDLQNFQIENHPYHFQVSMEYFTILVGHISGIQIPSPNDFTLKQTNVLTIIGTILFISAPVYISNAKHSTVMTKQFNRKYIFRVDSC